MDLNDYNEKDVDNTMDILNSETNKEYQEMVNKAKQNFYISKANLKFIVNEILYNRAIICQYENKIDLYKDRLKNTFSTFDDDEIIKQSFRLLLKDIQVKLMELSAQQRTLKSIRQDYERKFSEAADYLYKIQYK